MRAPMRSSAVWSTAAEPGRRVGHRIEFHASIGSTNDRAWQLLRAGNEGIAVVADLQTAGRGRHGRTWSSPPGVNLMVSVGVRVDTEPGDAWRLGAAAALALLDACRSVLPPASPVTLKWPNDLVDGDGRKVAGLLAETAIVSGRVREAVIGSGTNVNWPRAAMPDELADRATSLCELAGGQVDRVVLLRDYLFRLDAGIAAVAAGQSPVERFRAASWLTERRVEVAVGEANVAGTVAGIGDDGSLLLETDAGPLALGYGEVLRVSPAEGVPA